MASLINEMKRLATTQNPKLKPVGTIEGLLQHQIFACGVAEDLAIKIVDSLIASPGSQVMEGRWTDQAEGYPSHMIVVAWVIAQRHTIAYLKEHHPLHWALAMFEGPGVPVLSNVGVSLPPTGLP